MDDWVGEIRFAPEVETKLASRHNLHPSQVREAVSCGAHDLAAWDQHPVYGDRLVLTGTDATGTALIVYLRPLDREDGLWECLTAWKMDS